MNMRNLRRRGGFTLMEVLAAMMLLAIVLPVAMNGLSMGIFAAGNARSTAEAASLAQSKLNELVLTDQWSLSTTGDFAPENPNYQWTCASTSREFGVYEVVLTVNWLARGEPKSTSVSTMVLQQ